EEPSAEELEDFRQEQTDQVRAAHILFPLPEPAQQDSVRRLARAVLDSIRSGADFGEMARRYSVDASAQRGGDLGFFSRRDMVDPFSDAAFALQDSGDVVERPVKTRFGYHVIQLLGRRTVPPMDSLRARTALMQIRQRAAYDDAIKALRDQVTIQVNPEVLGVDLNVQ
ncbi:MAG: peptidylprolyl isomerase, partial [Rhodothermales bacterium]|nr:peptidylprolyl isomerase [Rhodothermales bacterium]